MFEGVLLSNQFWQSAGATRISMIWLNSGSGSDRQYIALNDWNAVTANDFTDTWGEAYAGTVAQAQLGREKSLGENNEILAGAFKVMEAFSMGMITSLWGDVPYSQVNQVTEFPNPVYDSQTSVYNAVQLLLDEAVMNLESGNGLGIPENGDLYYDGNVSKWVKLAHSLKARFYLHVKDYPNAYLSSLNGMSSVSDDMYAQYGPVYGQSFNPFYSFLVYDRDGYMSAIDSYAPDLLDSTSPTYRGNVKTDESARRFYNYIDFNVYSQGTELNFLNDFDWGFFENGKFGLDMPLITYGEMLLIQAEYQARNSGLSAGVSAYNSYRAQLNSANYLGGYEAARSHLYANYADVDFQSGGIENPDNIDELNAFLRELYEERYVFFIGHLEAFNDFGRTNNIAEIELKSGNTGTPQRFIYPQSEINSNPNVPSPLPSVTEKTPVNNL